MEFYLSNVVITIIKTNDLTDGRFLYHYIVWNKRGQMIDNGDIEANSYEDTKNYLKDIWRER